MMRPASSHQIRSTPGGYSVMENENDDDDTHENGVQMTSRTTSPAPEAENLITIRRPVYTEPGFESGFRGRRRRRRTLPDSNPFNCSCKNLSWRHILRSRIPITKWLPRYMGTWRQKLPGDLTAGLTVGVMHIPQGLAYALLANVDPVYGLYTSFIPALVYVLLGTSKHVSVGTFAVISLMVGEVVSMYAVDPTASVRCEVANSSVSESSNSSVPGCQSGNLTTVTSQSGPSAILVATSVTLTVGCLQLLMAIFQLGFVTIFLSEPLVSGYTTGAAFHVATSQVKHLFGIELKSPSNPAAFFKIYVHIFQHIGETNGATLLTGVVAAALLYSLKVVNQRYRKHLPFPIPSELIIVILGTVISWSAKFNERWNVKIVDKIPTGSPPQQFTNVGSMPFREVFSSTIAIAIVSFAIHVSIAQGFAKKHGYSIDANQEFIALGVGNIVGGFFSCVVGTGSLARSAVFESVGANTQLGTVFSAGIVILVVYIIAPLFNALPRAVLAAIILVALKNLFLQFRELKRLYGISVSDAAVWFVSWLAAIIFGVELGLAIAILFSLLIVLYRTSRPHTCLIGRAKDTDVYRDITMFQDVEQLPGIKIFRFESSLFFANVAYFRSCLVHLTGIDPASIQRDRLRHFSRASMSSMHVAARRNVREHLDAGELITPLAYITSLHAIVRTCDEIKKDHTSTSIHHVSESESDTDQEEIGLTEDSSSFINRTSVETAGPESSSVVVMATDELTVNSNLDVELSTIIVDCSPMNYMDTQAVGVLVSIAAEYEAIGIQFFLANCRWRVRRMLSDAGFVENIGSDHIFVTVHDAAVYAQNRQQPEMAASQNGLPVVAESEL